MTTRRLTLGVIVIALALAPSVGADAPRATKWQAGMTRVTSANGSTIKITKPSKVGAKVGPGNVTFSLKLVGVTDAGDAPVTLSGNTFQIDVIINGIFSTLMFNFDLANGFVSQKFSVANSSLPSGGVVAGQPIEIRGARVVQAMNGNSFGVAGITARGT